MSKHKVLLAAYGFTGEDALTSLLNQSSFDVIGVITPLYELGRYRKNLTELPVEKLAKSNNIEYLRTNKESEIAALINSKNPESVLVSSYNKILSPDLLNSGPSFYNVHHGDLPRWRGSSSSEWAVITGRNEIAMTMHKIIPGLDNGEIYWQGWAKINDNQNITDLRKEMKKVIRENLARNYENILEGKLKGQEQIGEATYTCSIREEDGLIDWTKPSKQIYNLIRGLCDPELDHAFTYYNGKKLEILSAQLIKDQRKFEGSIPGKPVAIYKEGIEILTGDGVILVKEILYEGNNMTANKAVKSIRNTLGSQLDYIKNLESRLAELEKKF
jgi:methionyl-tRNA formyltransferase